MTIAHRPKMTQSQCLNQLRDTIFEQLEKQAAPDYIPTGLQEDVILHVGQGKYQIILALHPNDVGKTVTGVNILRNIIWQCDPNYFAWWDGYSVYRDKNFHLKKFRIASVPSNLMEGKAIQTEIKAWWPFQRYEWLKGGKPYPSTCTTDNGWTGDALSYNQSVTAFESIKLSFQWWDEPGKADLIGASSQRFAQDGMLWLITATPVNAGAFLDVIDDLCDRGTKVKKLTGTADDNCIDDGKPNHLGTKRGIRTREQIEDKKRNCPLDEYDARILGKANYKTGRIYPTFDRIFHISDYDLNADYFKKANCFTTMDIHGKAYPFVQMWALTEDKTWICYNEWPTYEELGNNYYDEVRKHLICSYDIESLSRFIKIYEGSQWGLHILQRWMDPRAGKNSDGALGSTESYMAKFSRYGLDFDLPDLQWIENERDKIRSLLKHDIHDPLEKPQIVFMPHCVNSIRMIERHYWDDDKEKESEQYKEGPDCMRILFAGFRDRKFKTINSMKNNHKLIKTIENPIVTKMKEMAQISMS